MLLLSRITCVGLSLGTRVPFCGNILNKSPIGGQLGALVSSRKLQKNIKVRFGSDETKQNEKREISNQNPISYLPLFFREQACLDSSMTRIVPKSNPPSAPFGKLMSRATSYASAVIWMFSVCTRPIIFSMSDTWKINCIAITSIVHREMYSTTYNVIIIL